ncbi:hypothetical protein X963_4864 [Burkholderia pseudomallei MSHR7498]|nr:hypothetical protein X963_4864 [Burkholderia pseudomallei MSHR7498]
MRLRELGVFVLLMRILALQPAASPRPNRARWSDSSNNWASIRATSHICPAVATLSDVSGLMPLVFDVPEDDSRESCSGPRARQCAASAAANPRRHATRSRVRIH